MRHNPFRPLDKDVAYRSRQAFLHGSQRSIPAFASAGIDLWVGVHAPVAEIESRERLRGNRQIGAG